MRHRIKIRAGRIKRPPASRLVGCAALLLSACGPGRPEPLPVHEVNRLSRVSERPGAVRIEGIGPILGFANGRDCTFMHCLELILEPTGRRIGYDELMGLSGMAFRLQFREDRWDVGNSDPLVGESCLEPLFAAIGWDYEVHVVRRADLAGVELLYRAVNRSIDEGYPVLATNVIPPEDWGIITGYRGPRTWLCRSYNGGAEHQEQEARGWPTAVVLLTARKPRPPVRPARLDSLRRAVELFNRRADGPWALGARAFDVWCDRLRAPRDRSYVHANFWTYVCLVDARAAAARYLRAIAADLGPAEPHVGMAADWYDREARLLGQGFHNVPSEKLYPDVMPPAELRNRQIDTLREARSCEEKAVESLSRAVR